MSGGCGGGGTKSLRLPPRTSRVLSLSLYPWVSLFFLSLQPLFPAFPSPSHAFIRPNSPSSFLPFRHGGLSRSFFLFPLRLFLCHRTAPAVPVSRPLLSLSDTRSLPPSLFLPFSTVPPLPLLLPNVTTSVAFSPMLPGLSSSSTCKPIAHASERTRRSESRRERGSEIEREKESEYRIHERAKTRRGRAGAREREVERDQRRDVPAKSDGIRRGRKEEEEGEKRWMLKRGRASGTPANGRNVR